MKQITNNKTELKEAITEVIVFFDKFDFPLTSFEVWRYIKLKAEYLEVLSILEKINTPVIKSPEYSGWGPYNRSTSSSPTQGVGTTATRQSHDHRTIHEIASLPLAMTGEKTSATTSHSIQSKNGFYYFNGREAIVETRMKRYNYASRKFKKAMFFSRLFKFVPWVKMIAIGNIIGPNNMRNAGDIDFFIITERKRIWMTRAMCVLIAKLLRARPDLYKTRDTICLSFYATEDNLDLTELTYGKSDYYFLYWLACLLPVYDTKNFYKKLINENKWLISQLPNWKKGIVSEKRKIKPRKSVFYHDIIDMFIGGLEPWAKKKQLQIMPESLARAINHPSKAVVINDKFLKLHVNDRREEYNKNF